MNRTAKSASAFVRAFLAIPVLELEDMVVHWFARSSLAAFMAIVLELTLTGHRRLAITVAQNGLAVSYFSDRISLL